MAEYGNASDAWWPLTYTDAAGTKKGQKSSGRFYTTTTTKKDDAGKEYQITSVYEDQWGIGVATHRFIGTLDSRKPNTFVSRQDGAVNARSSGIYSSGTVSQIAYFSSQEGMRRIRLMSEGVTRESLRDQYVAEGLSYKEANEKAKKRWTELNEYTNISLDNSNSDKEDVGQGAVDDPPKPATYKVKGVSQPNQGTLWSERAFSSKSRTLVYPEDHAPQEYDFIKITPIEYVPALEDETLQRTRGTSVSTAGENYSIDVNDEDWFGFKSIRKRYLRVKQVGSTMFLPMTPDIQENNGVDWGGDRLNPIQAAAGRIAFDAIGNISDAPLRGTGQLMSDLGTAGNAFADNPQIGSFIKAYFAGKAVNANLLGRAGIVINPNLEVLFNGPQLRTFQYNFRFTPRTDSEAKTVRTIIKVLKKTMAPKRRDKVFLSVPAVYLIKYVYNSERKNHPFLNKIKPCALSGLNVQYAPDGNYMTYDDGSMTSYTVTMQFNELEPIFNDDIRDVDDPTTGF